MILAAGIGVGVGGGVGVGLGVGVAGGRVGVGESVGVAVGPNTGRIPLPEHAIPNRPMPMRSAMIDIVSRFIGAFIIQPINRVNAAVVPKYMIRMSTRCQ